MRKKRRTKCGENGGEVKRIGGLSGGKRGRKGREEEKKWWWWRSREKKR